MPEDLAVAALARRAGRPVKWIETRRENLAAATQAREQRVEIEAAADADGTLRALRASLVSDGGAYHVYPLTGALEALGAASILPGPIARRPTPSTSPRSPPTSRRSALTGRGGAGPWAPS